MIQPTHFIDTDEFAAIGPDPLFVGNTACRAVNTKFLELVSIPTANLRPVAEKHKAGCKVWYYKEKEPDILFEAYFCEMKQNFAIITAEHPSSWKEKKPRTIYTGSAKHFTFTEPKAKE